MSRRNFVCLLGSCLLLACASSAQDTAATAAALAGKWEIPLPVHGAASVYQMTTDIKGDTFTGMIANFPIAEGKINGGEITFKLMAGARPSSVMTAKIYGDQMSFLIEDAPEKPNRHIGVQHSWTAFRNRGNEPLTWVPDVVPPLPVVATTAQKSTSATNPGLAGRWEAPYVWGSKTYTYEFVFDGSGNGFSGNAALLGSSETYKIGDGKVEGNNISFAWLQEGKPVARFTGTLYGGQIGLVMEEAGGKRFPEATGGKTHPMTAFRNDGDVPWYTWLPSGAPRGKMSSYAIMAQAVRALYQKNDIKNAAALAGLLEHDWDSRESALLKSLPDVWVKIDHSMDLFVLPLIRYQGGMPDPAEVEKAYQNYLIMLKLAN